MEAKVEELKLVRAYYNARRKDGSNST